EDPDETVLDRLTGLMWMRNANIAEYPLSWSEALDYVRDLNEGKIFGHDDWRMPNRRELRSLISHQDRRPALPGGHPFRNVFLGWYWTGTSSAVHPGYAWYVHMEGGRMFYGNKKQYFLLWPVRGQGIPVLPATGQVLCFDADGRTIPCDGTGQDGELRVGAAWPTPRFTTEGNVVHDHLTGLVWTRSADLAGGTVNWLEALRTIDALNQQYFAGFDNWRLPTINELESLTDASRHRPALPEGHPFETPGQTYCSSTTSAYEPDWVMVLHMDKGAVGVGQKKSKSYYVWSVVRRGEERAGRTSIFLN
ncbi:MAG: DUF1566 domain-containing protein, partial [Deltaproteobacteria bacterium]|nr:DUF1566 domain-containing protein [Deltaproteobacteria bacterium]